VCQEDQHVWIHQLWRRLSAGSRSGSPRVESPTQVRQTCDAFQKAIGIRFCSQSLLQQALTHRSYLGSNGGDTSLSNERIEFLGDAVLELAVIEFLFRVYPEDREGSLTKKKGLLVSRDVLAQCAERMHLGDYVLLSEAERESGGSARSSILSDTLEAVIGATYLDQGLEVAKKLVHQGLLVDADAILEDQSLSNHKSLLQEIVQARFKTHPRYRVVTESGPDHHKLFTVEVSVRGSLLGRGQGHNKKVAEQMAARDALAHLPEAPVEPTASAGSISAPIAAERSHAADAAPSPGAGGSPSRAE
jgi:ribonuclease III